MIHNRKVEIDVSVTIDPAKFTKKFMKEFRATFYNFQSVSDHVDHLAQLYARGLADNGSFIEGYGPAADMGIAFKQLNVDVTPL